MRKAVIYDYHNKIDDRQRFVLYVRGEYIIRCMRIINQCISLVAISNNISKEVSKNCKFNIYENYLNNICTICYAFDKNFTSFNEWHRQLIIYRLMVEFDVIICQLKSRKSNKLIGVLR